MSTIDLKKLLDESVLEIRGDGKAGSGLVLVLQSLSDLFIREDNMHVQEWPFFSAARKGAAVRSNLRASRKPITISSEITNPHISILMDEGAAKFVDFAAGVPQGGTFVLNTTHTPVEAAKHYKLSGRVLTVDGDNLGLKHLKKPLGNISVLAVLVKAMGLDPEIGLTALTANFKKRRLPEAIIKANIELYRESLTAYSEGVFEEGTENDHKHPSFAGYGDLPDGAQTGLRISRSNLTAAYARAGVRVAFEDPDNKCTGCTLCITGCPENIIKYIPDDRRGVKVVGADFASYCKTCRECEEICPEGLFKEVPFEEPWKESSK